MKQLIYILLLIPRFAWGQSAAAPLTNMERLERDFARPHLSDAQLDAFGVRAEQKLKDFCDYTLVLADTAYPAEMLNHLQEMARSSFREETSRVLGLSLSEYIAALRNAQSLPLRLDPESFTWKQAFTLDESQKQLGSLAFRDERGKTYVAQISLQYVPKRFGNETQYVWTLLLEEIMLLDGR